MQRAPRPVLVRGEGGEQSALSTLILAQLLPQLTSGNGSAPGEAGNGLRDAVRERIDGLGDGEG